MESGVIPIDDLAGWFDLQSTLESGQTFRWERADGRTYESAGGYGGSNWYHTTHDGEVIRTRQRDDRLEWEATIDAVPVLIDQLGLDDDLTAIRAAAPDDALIQRAFDAYRGMRIVRDPFFPCLIAFICSAQMRLERIFEMQRALRQTYGESITVDGTTYYTFPTPERLAAATERELRELRLGYRAPYVRESAEMIATGSVTQETIPDDYEGAHDALQAFVGVGDKVADCVCMFSLGHLEAIPLDTWIQTAIEEYYPECDRGSYVETADALRERFGRYPGYTQTYVFHYLRAR